MPDRPETVIGSAMAVYVDDMYKSRLGRFKGYRMSHMLADSHQELMEMSVRLGLKPEWLQNAGTHKEHFDIPVHKREQALALGAIPISMRDAVLIIRHKLTSHESR